ncbi:MAG: hypothetical protein R3D60_06075 [Paracoccaceae bacterium]
MAESKNEPQHSAHLDTEVAALKAEFAELSKALAEYKGLSRGMLLWIFTILFLVFGTALALIPGVQVGVSSLLGVDATLYGAGADAATTAAASSGVFPQFMTLFLAVAAGGIAYMASMMGMRRLENYDQQFQKLRADEKELEREIRTRLAQSETAIAKVKSEIDDEKQATTFSITTQVESAASTLRDEVRRFSQASEEQQKEYEDRLEEKFGFITELGPGVRHILVDAPSVSEVHRKVTIWSLQNEMSKVRELVKAVLANRYPDREALKTTGDSVDWFNLGSQLGQNDEYLLGLKVNIAGLLQEGSIRLQEGVSGVQADSVMTFDMGQIVGQDGNGQPRLLLRHPNIDLLAHSISYANKLGFEGLLSDLIAIAKLLPIESRNWRYYQFLGDHYAERNDKTEFDVIVDEFERRIATDERSIAMRIAWHLARNEYDDVLKIGRKWMRNTKARGNSVPLRLAQVALDAGDYDFVLDLTARGLEGSAESQPTANIGAILFYRANAYDSLFCREFAKAPRNCARLVELYESARRLYASKIVLDVRHQETPAKKRLDVLRIMLEETGCKPGTLQEPEEDDSSEVDEGRDIRAVLNDGIGAFLRSEDEEKAVEQFRALSDEQQALGQGLLAAFANEDDTPEHIAAAARRFLDAVSQTP